MREPRGQFAFEDSSGLQGNRVAARQTGPYRDLEPSGRTTTWTGTHTDRYEGDELVESWVDWDKFSFSAARVRFPSSATARK